MPAPTRARRAIMKREPCKHEGGAIEYANGWRVCDRCFARIDNLARKAPPARRARKRNAPTRPLACHVCGEDSPIALRVDTDTDYIKRGNGRRVAAYVTCLSCDNQWDSVHPDAVAQARAKQAAAHA